MMLATPTRVQVLRAGASRPPLRPGVARRGLAVTPHTTSCKALKLYEHPMSRSKLIEWYLQEINETYDTVYVDIQNKAQKSDWYLKINPCGKLPAIEDGNLKLFESGAILLYLADKHGKTPTPEDRALAAQWTFFANATMVRALFDEQAREKDLHVVMSVLNDSLSKQEYLLGNFTVADVAVGSYLLYIPKFFPQLDLSAYPAVQAYMQRLKERPACQATLAAA